MYQALPIQVLLAEDNPADQHLVAEALRAHGLEHEMRIIPDGAAAAEFAAHAGGKDHPCPDIFILDLHLPYIDGPEVLRLFRENGRCTHTPVLVLTSSASPKERQTVECFAGVYYFLKPSDLDAFLEIGAFVKKLLLMHAHAG